MLFSWLQPAGQSGTTNSHRSTAWKLLPDEDQPRAPFMKPFKIIQIPSDCKIQADTMNLAVLGERGVESVIPSPNAFPQWMFPTWLASSQAAEEARGYQRCKHSSQCCQQGGHPWAFYWARLNHRAKSPKLNMQHQHRRSRKTGNYKSAHFTAHLLQNFCWAPLFSSSSYLEQNTCRAKSKEFKNAVGNHHKKEVKLGWPQLEPGAASKHGKFPSFTLIWSHDSRNNGPEVSDLHSPQHIHTIPKI